MTNWIGFTPSRPCRPIARSRLSRSSPMGRASPPCASTCRARRMVRRPIRTMPKSSRRSHGSSACLRAISAPSGECFARILAAVLSTALLLLFLLEGRLLFFKSSSLSGRGGSVSPPIIVGPSLLIVFCFRTARLVKCRAAFAVRGSVLLSYMLVTRSIFPTRIPAGLLWLVLGAVPGFCRMRPLRRRISQQLDADVVFLVGPLDLGGERVGDARRNLELGGGIHDADRADVLLLDAAAATNHRQQPARLRILSAADRGAKPHATFRHGVAAQLLASLRSRLAIVAARRMPVLAAVLAGVAIVTRAAAGFALAGVQQIFGRGQPGAIKPVSYTHLTLP